MIDVYYSNIDVITYHLFINSMFWILRFTNVGCFFNKQLWTFTDSWKRQVWRFLRWMEKVDGWIFVGRVSFVFWWQENKNMSFACVKFLDPKIMFLDFLEKWVEELVEIIKFSSWCWEYLVYLPLLAVWSMDHSGCFGTDSIGKQV